MKNDNEGTFYFWLILFIAAGACLVESVRTMLEAPTPEDKPEEEDQQEKIRKDTVNYSNRRRSKPCRRMKFRH
jgi:hypothetical protein